MGDGGVGKGIPDRRAKPLKLRVAGERAGPAGRRWAGALADRLDLR